MSDQIPYPSPSYSPLREIYPYLQGGVLPTRSADNLLQKGLDWVDVAPFIEDQQWWSDQTLGIAPPLRLPWRIIAWGATLNLKTPQISIWIDPGPNAPMPERHPDLIIVTHAHSDHTARLAEFSAAFPDCPVVMSRLTAEMLSLRASKDILLWECLQNRTIKLPFNEERILSDVTLRFLPAGHLLGAAMIEIKLENDCILVTGDFAFRDVGGLPPAHWPERQYNLVIMESATAGRGSPPRADVESNRRPYLIKVSEMLRQFDRFFVSAQSFGQAQELYAALVMAQRSGAFPTLRVYLTGLASVVSDRYAKALGNLIGPWSCHYEDLKNNIPQDSVVITGSDRSETQILSTLKIFTHAGWSEHMALAVGLACHSIAFYHGDPLSLYIALSELGRDIRILSQEKDE